MCTDVWSVSARQLGSGSVRIEGLMRALLLIASLSVPSTGDFSILTLKPFLFDVVGFSAIMRSSIRLLLLLI